MKLIRKTMKCHGCGKTYSVTVASDHDVVRCPHCQAWN